MTASDEIEHYDESVEYVRKAIEDETEGGRQDHYREKLNHHLRIKQVNHSVPRVPSHQDLFQHGTLGSQRVDHQEKEKANAENLPCSRSGSDDIAQTRA